MPDTARKSHPARRKATARRAQRNRYYRHAKLSEYKFLKVLRAFADDRIVEEAATIARVSERTVRALYGQLREALLRAAMLDPFAFGAIGYFVFEKDDISRRGAAIFDAVAASDHMRRVIDRHGARVGLTTEAGASFSYLLFETTTRIFCALAIRMDNETLYPDDIQEAYAGLQLVALYIAMHKDNPDDPVLFGEVLGSFERIMKDFPALLEKEELASLIARHRRHRFPGQVLFNDLRRYLLKNPL